MIAIGIDPGQGGGIAWVSSAGLVVANKMPSTVGDIVEMLGLFRPREDAGPFFAFIESVHAMPKQGVSSTFKFGQNFGTLLGILSALGIPYERVTPGKWQKEFGLIRRDKNETITAKKNRHKAKMQELFPGVKATHAIADAVLIAEYCRRTMARRCACVQDVQ